MIVERCKQGGAVWHRHRLGIPTASHFYEILTPKTREPSKQAVVYMDRLLAEFFTGVPADAAVSAFMDRGTEYEPRARGRYALERDVDIDEVGVILRDDRLVAASPDGLVGEDGQLELKTPGAIGHIRNLRDGMKGYESQVQGGLWLSGRAWCDLVSYHPDMPMAVVRYVRDEEHIEQLEAAVSVFVKHLLRERAALIELGCVPAERLNLPLAAVAKDSPEPF